MQEQKNNHDIIKGEQTNPAGSLENQSQHKKRRRKILKFTGLIIVSAALYLLLFIYGQPTIDTDYVAELNKLNKPANYNEEDNAWSYYQKAFELYKDPNFGQKEEEIIYLYSLKSFSDINEPEQKIVLNWIEKNQAAWQEFETASRKPYCYINNREQETNPYYECDVPTLQFNMRYLGKLRKMCFFGKYRIKMEIENKYLLQAVEDCITLLGCSFQWYKSNLFAEEITAWLLNSDGCKELLKILPITDFQSSQLQEFQKQLESMCKSCSFTYDMKGEKITFLDIVQHSFTKGGFGGGHLIPKYLQPLVRETYSAVNDLTFRQYILYCLFPDYMDYQLQKLNIRTEYISSSNMNRMFRNRFLCYPISLFHARRNDTITKYNQLFKQIQEIQKMTPFQIKQANISIKIEQPDIVDDMIQFSFTKKNKYFLIGLFIPDVTEDISNRVFVNKATYESIITILAIKRYKIDNGIYPETLDELLNKGYIVSIPMDPFSDKPLVYKKTDTDFTLYSLGEDFNDDGGTRSTNSSRNIVTWARRSTDKQGCDAVFWPIK
jgi:hypothetical protein